MSTRRNSEEWQRIFRSALNQATTIMLWNHPLKPGTMARCDRIAAHRLCTREVHNANIS